MNRRLALVIGIAIVVILTVGIVSMPLNVIPLITYGNPDLWEETNDVQLSEGDVLNVRDGDTLCAWLVDDPDTQHKPTDLLDEWTVTLRRADTDAWIENAGDSSKVGELYPSVVGESIRWWFNLESCLEGTFDYVVFWFAMIGDTEVEARGYSFAFAVVNEEPPVYDDAEFVTEPATQLNYTVGQLAAYATWKVHYDGAYTASVTVDGTEDWTESNIASTGDELIIYTVNTTVAGTQSIVLTITPDVADNPPLVSDTVTVTIAGDGNDDTDTTTTTTTTTDTTTTTPTTTTEPPPPEELEYLWVYLLIAIVVIAVVVKVAK